MLNSKERSQLRSVASTQRCVAQVGKEGITDALLISLREAIEKRELIKVNLLPASSEDGENLALNIAELLGAELVTVIGRKAVFYKKNEENEQ